MQSLEDLYALLQSSQTGDDETLSKLIEEESQSGYLSNLLLTQPSPESYVAYKLLCLMLQRNSTQATQCIERVIVAVVNGNHSYFGWRLCSVATESSGPCKDSVTRRVQETPDTFPLSIIGLCGGCLTLETVVGIAIQRLEEEDSVDLVESVMSKEVTNEDVESVLQSLFAVIQDERLRGKPVQKGYWIQALLYQCSKAVMLENREALTRQTMAQFVSVVHCGEGNRSQAVEIVEMINHQDEMLFSSLISLRKICIRLGLDSDPLHYAALFSALLSVYDYDYELFVDLILSSEASVLCVEYLLGVMKIAAAEPTTFVAVGRFDIPRLVHLLGSLELVISSASFPFNAAPLVRALHQVKTLMQNSHG